MKSLPQTAQSAELLRLTQAFVADQPFLHHLGVDVVSATPGRCELTLHHRAELAQPDGCFHEGVIATAATGAGGAAAHTMLPAGAAALTVEFKVNIMALGKGESLIARGQVIRSGKSLTVCRAEVFAVSEGQEVPCATCLMTLMAAPR